MSASAIRDRWVGVVVALSVVASVVACSGAVPATKVQTETISGTGNMQAQSQPKMQTETLPPAGVVLNTRMATMVFTGLIDGASQDAITHVLRNPSPTESVFYGVWTLENATVGQRHGSMVIEVKGSSQGDVNVTPGTHAVYQLTLVSGTGDFAGAEGHGLAIGKTLRDATGITYWMQLVVSKK